MATEQSQIIENGHLVRTLLRDFVEDPDRFDDDDVEAIWAHLDECEGCMEDYDQLQESGAGAELSVKDDDSGAPAEPAANSATEAITLGDDDFERATLPKPDTAEEPSEESPELEKSEEPQEPEEPEQDDAPTAICEAVSSIGGGETQAEAESETGETAPDEPEPEIFLRTTDEIGNHVTRGTSGGPADDDTTDQPDEPLDEAREDPFWEDAREEAGKAGKAGDEPLDQPAEAVGGVPEGSPERLPSTPEVEDQIPRLKSSASPSAPGSNIPGYVKTPQFAIACLVVFLAAVAAFLFLRPGTPEHPNPVAGWATSDVIGTRTPLQEIPLRRIRKGTIAALNGVTDVDLDFRGIKELVIAVDLDFLSGTASSYHLVVKDKEEVAVFHEQIPEAYVSDGRIFLRLIPKQFTVDNLYTLELVAHENDGNEILVGECVFRALK
jgi:hypothetical protein